MRPASAVIIALSAVQAINELHEDEDFQQDAGQSHILGVVDEIRTDASAMAKYEKDAVVMHVLKKLRRFQVHRNAYLRQCRDCAALGVSAWTVPHLQSHSKTLN